MANLSQDTHAHRQCFDNHILDKLGLIMMVTGAKLVCGRLSLLTPVWTSSFFTHYLIPERRHIAAVVATSGERHEGKAGMVLFAGKTV